MSDCRYSSHSSGVMYRRIFVSAATSWSLRSEASSFLTGATPPPSDSPSSSTLSFTFRKSLAYRFVSNATPGGLPSRLLMAALKARMAAISRPEPSSVDSVRS